jgi:hypothetical protein
MSPLRKLFFCHQNTKTQNLTKIKLLNFSLLCNLEFWRFGGIFNFLTFRSGHNDETI